MRLPVSDLCASGPCWCWAYAFDQLIVMTDANVVEQAGCSVLSIHPRKLTKSWWLRCVLGRCVLPQSKGWP